MITSSPRSPWCMSFCGCMTRWLAISSVWFVLAERHAGLELTKVNTYGLIFVRKGSESVLKPLLLTAHQGSFISVCIMSVYLTSLFDRRGACRTRYS